MTGTRRRDTGTPFIGCVPCRPGTWRDRCPDMSHYVPMLDTPGTSQNDRPDIASGSAERPPLRERLFQLRADVIDRLAKSDMLEPAWLRILADTDGPRDTGSLREVTRNFEKLSRHFAGEPIFRGYPPQSRDYPDFGQAEQGWGRPKPLSADQRAGRFILLL